MSERKGMIQMSKSIGEKIKYLRTISNLSQDELGKRVGVQRAAINKYEKGTVNNIPIVTIEKIARVFDVSPTYLVGWDNVEINPLAAEVKVLQGVKKFYGGDVVDLIELYVHLNPTGKKRVVQYSEDMSVVYANVDDIL
jgi:transcriptional regulator with XRE-family HTH domain